MLAYVLPIELLILIDGLTADFVDFAFTPTIHHISPLSIHYGSLVASARAAGAAGTMSAQLAQRA